MYDRPITPDGTRRRRLLPGALLIASLVLAVGGGLGVERMDRSDQEHARFYSVGSSVKSFLGEFCQALEESYESGDLTPLDGMYSASFHSPRRRSWSYGAAQRPRVWSHAERGTKVRAHAQRATTPSRFPLLALRAGVTSPSIAAGKGTTVGC